jgi:NADH-quinone oxidoreductase subunit G
VDWEVALTAAAEGLQKSAGANKAATGFLASPMSTVEELYLLAQMARGLGCANIDHRLRQLDFRAQENEAPYPHLGLKIADVERLEGVLIVGSDLRREMPLLAHRIRKAAVKGGAQVAFLNPRRFDLMFPVAGYVTAPADMVGELSALVHAAAGAAGKPVPAGTAAATVTDAHRALIGALSHGTRRALILGTLAQRHPAYSQLKALSAALADLCGASFGCITEGANAAGAYLAGAVPHRNPGGAPVGSVGFAARQMMETWLKAYVLLGGIDPAHDLCVDPGALASADLVIAVTTHLPESLRGVVHVVLPIGSFAETSGTYVSAEGRWQSWAGAAKLPGESRPGWKVLRVLANLLGLHGIDYNSSDEVRDALKALCGTRIEASPVAAGAIPNGSAAIGSWVDIPPYQGDVLVRGSEALQKTKDGRMTRSVI